MPSGKTHDRITVIGAALAAPVYFLATPPPPNFTACLTLVGVTLFSGLMLSPDLDLDSSIYRRWGPLRFLWWPYQKLLPHRSWLSHSLIVAPILRIAYFALVTWLLWRGGTWIVSYFVAFDRNGMSQAYADSVFGLWNNYPHHALMAAIGLFYGTALHVGADVFVSYMKSRLRRRKRRRRE